MVGLPRSKDTSRPREAFSILCLESVERLTTALRRGDAFTAQGLADMRALCRRLESFKLALDERESLVVEERT